MGINHNRRVLFWWSKLFAAEERRVSFGAASQLSCQILPRFRSTRESGFSSMFCTGELTQGFFTRLLEKHYMRDVVRERGRFRSFLLDSVEHFVANERDRQRRTRL